MTNQHPITPPSELVQEWIQETIGTHFEPYGYSEFIANSAAKWGANQELEACCEWVTSYCPRWPDGTKPEAELRAARRPKPPSLKEQLLQKLDLISDVSDKYQNTQDAIDDLRRALEALPE